MDRRHSQERAKILGRLRSKLSRGSILVQTSTEELSLSEDQLVEQLKALQPKSNRVISQSYDKFQFFWRHPATRLLFVMALWCLDMYIFGEDPTTYSTTPCRIGGIGHIINLFHFTEGDTLPWILLRLSLLLIFSLSGLLFAKMLKKRLALRFEMFTYKGSYFIITGAVLVIALAICAKVYNKIRWKIVCNDYDADCSCEDAKCGGYLSNDLHMQNNTFARLTQCGAFIADTLAVFSVLDLTLQDDSVYHISSSFNVSGFWEKHRSKILWGGFALLMILGIPSIVFSSGAFLAYQQKFSLGHRSNIGRMVVAGTLFVVDLCIVTQDLDFPHFENSLEVMLLGTNIAFEGSFINYIMVFVSMILDLNCLYTHGWYRPTDYGQFYLEKSRRICNRQHVEEYLQVNCSSPRCPLVRFSEEERGSWNGRDACEAKNLLLGSRYHPEIKEWRLFLAVVPIMAGIILFCTLFRLAGRSSQNLCRRVVISNAFAAKRVEESRSVELTEIAGVHQLAAVTAPTTSVTSVGREQLLATLDADGHADGHGDGLVGHRVIVVTAAGVRAFELRDNPRSPYGGIQGAWMSPHVFCTRLRYWLWRKMHSWQGSGSLELHGSSSRDYLYARVQDLKEKLRTEGLIRTDVPFHSLELLWQGRLLHNETVLRSLGEDAILYLLYDRWSLRRTRLAAWRAEVF